MRKVRSQFLGNAVERLVKSDNRYDKDLCAFVVYIFDVLENDMHLKSNKELVRVTRLSSATLYKIRKLAEMGQLTNKRQVRTIQRLAEVANVKPFRVPE